jgi:RNA polymerase sigma-70 factor (ECF subfamily)
MRIRRVLPAAHRRPTGVEPGVPQDAAGDASGLDRLQPRAERRNVLSEPAGIDASRPGWLRTSRPRSGLSAAIDQRIPWSARRRSFDRRNLGVRWPSMEDDLVLLDRWCAGDKLAGNELFLRHFEALYRFFEHKTDGDIDDLVQETFLACVRGRETFRRQSSFRTYLFAIARHVLLAYWRRRASSRQTLDFDEISVASLSTSAGTRLVKRQDRAALLAALRELPLDQQLLLEMYYWQELDRSQLAEVFDVEEATIGSRLFRARKQLQDTLGTESAPPGRPLEQFDDWARRQRTDTQ